MISLRLWLFSLLLALPFYTYSLNARSPYPQEDVFNNRRDFDDIKDDLEKRQQIATDTEVLASVSSVLASVSSIISYYSDNPSAITNLEEIQASLSSVILSVSSDLYPILTDVGLESPTPTTDGGSSGDITSAPSEETATAGQVITDGTRTGTVGTDGTTRFCSASSYLCPASVGYGCFKEDYSCGLTACFPNGAPTTSGLPTPSSSCSAGFFLCPSSLGYGCCQNGYTCGLSACTGPSTDAIQSKTDIFFQPDQSKGSNSDPTATPTSQSSGGLSGAAIGGIVGGVVGGIALIVAGVVWFCLSKRKNKNTALATTGPQNPPTEQYTGGQLPPQPPMTQYNTPISPPPQAGYQSPPPPQQQGAGGYYQPYNQQYPGGQQGPPTQGGYTPYGQNVSELGGAAMPYGQKDVNQPSNIQEAPANEATQQQPPQGPPRVSAGPVYELS